MTRKIELLNEWEASEEYETIHFTDWLVKRIAELEKELNDLRQYLHTGEMPKENEG